MNTRLLCLLAGLATTLFAHADNELVIYSGRSDKFVQPVVDAFALETGISVILRSGNASELLDYLHQEAGHTDADVYISDDAGNLQRGSDWHLFAPLAAELTADIPARYRAVDHTWTGVATRFRVLVINKKFKAQHAISSVLDLGRPELKNLIATTSSSNENFISGVTIYLALLGMEPIQTWLQSLKTNIGTEVFSKHSHIVKAVAAGQRGIGLVNHSAILRHLAEYPDDPIELLAPDQGENGMGLAWNVAGIAQIMQARHADKALAFVKFVLSDEGQAMFAAVNMEYPVRAGVKIAPGLPPSNAWKIADFPIAILDQQRQTTVNLIGSVGMP